VISGPQPTHIGNFDASITSMIVLSDCGQVDAAPTGVAAHS